MAKEAENLDVRHATGSNGGRESIEEMLGNIWAGVLRVPHVEKHANFFEIGGDSLKAMEVISRVREVLQVDLPLISFFEEPTVVHLAEVLSGQHSELEDSLSEIWAEVLHVQRVERDANFFEIGGDSLKAMDVIARVSDVLHVDLPLVAFFEEPTIRHLADVLSAVRESTADNLAKIWAEVLRVSEVERDANFFDIGGDSLKAMEVIARVNEVLKVDLPLIAFFEEPTVDHLAQVIDGLKAEGTTPPMVRVADRSEFPLSYSQQIFWLLEQQNPETGIYNKPRIFRIHGTVDEAVMERSLNELRERHEVLRVRFVSGVNGPMQIVQNGRALELVVDDLSEMDAARREQAAMKLALETVREPLDLAGGQVQRARLIRFSEDEFLLCISEHHVVNDGYTGSILLDELGAIYDAFAAGEPNPLPPVEFHYTDFAVWEREWMQGQRLANEVEFWRSLLQGAPTHLDLPTDFAPGADPGRRGHLRSLMLSGELLQRIRDFARSNGTTQFTIMAAALRLLLYRWSGQTDFLLGTVASNRSRSGTERMPGAFVNPLPLRNPVQDGDTASRLLSHEKRAVMEVFAHQDCPFPKIVEAVNPERNTSDNPLFNVGLVMENFPEIALKGRHFEAEYLNFDPEVSLLDLRFIAVEKHGGLRLSCEYKSAMFTTDTVDALLQAYLDVLSAMIESPGRPVGEFVLPKALVRQAEASATARRQVVAIAATFTAEPAKEALEFWLQQLGMPKNIEFALFNQVFQQLLDSSSLLASNHYGINVVLLRMEDLRVADGTSAEDVAAGLHRMVEELLAALRVAARREAAPVLLLMAPPSDGARSNADLAAAIEREEKALVETARGIQQLQVVGSKELLDLYPVADYSDEYNYKISHIPYKPAMFTALASMIARRIYTAHHAAPEVIVFDGDSTFGAPTDEVARRQIAEFLLAQEQSGMILGLCSRNDEASVSSRFDGAVGQLGWQDIASTRTGVRALSEAVREIADELSLSLNCCIFVTADPIDAAEVRANCPSVLIAELPAEPQFIPAFLRNFWAFDSRPPVAAQNEAPTKPGLLSLAATQFSSMDATAQAVEAAKVIRTRESGEYAAPRSPAEEFLADVWSRLLRIDRPSIHDNFFALGGHSLMAAQVIARVRQTLEVELPLRSMFEAPTIAQFAEMIETERRARTGIVVPPMTRVSRESQMPLSYAQQRLWFIDQFEPGSPAYNISAMYRLRGQLDVAALEHTINEIVRRHESLRTTFSNVEGHPVAIISPQVSISLTPQPVSGIDPQASEENLRDLAHQEAQTPFDLAKGPLIRCRLLRINADDHALLIIVHHIVGDGWSGSLIAGELAALYDAFTHDRPSPLPELEIQYADFAVWQRQWLEGEGRDRQVEYWRRLLAGAPAVLELPTDRPRPAVQKHRGDVRTHVIPNELIERLTTISQGDGATLFMALLAAFHVLLSRYSRQDDIVVGSTVASRNYAEIEPLIGFFVNTLPLRADLSGNPTFRELLKRVRQVALDGYAHQELPFEKLVEEIRPERSLSYNPVFQVLFGLQNVPRRYFEASGLSVERSSIHQSTSILDMSWFAFPTVDGMLLRVEYDVDLFDDATVERMASQYQTLLEGIAASPESHIAELPLLSEAERHKLLVEFNQTTADFPRHDLAHEFVARQAEATPDAVALVVGDEQLTYRELNDRANQLAHYLMERGAGPEVLVGIYSERSSNMLVGILGILKSGSAYVPLDPNYPRERIRDILEDAKAPLIVTHSSIVGDLPESAGPHICLDTDWPAISQQPRSNPVTSATQHNLAYVLFTSGSTGRPKGVAIEHRSVATFVHWVREAFTPQELAGVLFSTSMCFDLSIFEMLGPLSSGGSVILAENALYLPTLPAKDNVTLINTVPSAMTELLRMNGVPGSVATVNLAGEALSEILVESIYKNTNVQRVYNLYGPTEDTTYSTYTLVSRGTSVTIGRPLSNSQAYVLDTYLRPVPIAVPGELYLAGDGLARCYYGRPDLTAERFVRNPFSREDGARMYRTGDLCRYLPNGEIEYLGRIDHQVKLRGFRIELGEIETVLDGHPGVRQSIVMVREDVPGDKRLVAYIVSNTSSKGRDLVAALKGRVAEKLPEFMVPSAFVVLESMPLSANGKVNRNALPKPEISRDESDAYVAPRNAGEAMLAEIWSEVLRLPQVGVHDNFFRLGGHSLLATQVVSRIRKAVGVEVPLRQVFEWPTIAELASRIEETRASEGDAVPPIQRAPRDQALPLSFAQRRLWFLHQLDPESPLYNVPLTIRLSGALDVESLQRALNEIVRRHEVLRTSYQVQDDVPVQVITNDVKIEVPILDHTGLPLDVRERTIRRIAVENGEQVFNLQVAPVLRACLLKFGDQDHALVLNTHHIASDGWSAWRFVSELAALYKAFLEGKPSPLPELPIQYADFAIWQRGWMRSEVFDQQLSYWKEQLEGAPTCLELHTDHTRPAVPTYRGAMARNIFPPELAAKLQELARREDVTLYMVLLAAYQALLFRHSGQEDFTVGSPIANRIRSEMEDLIGFFVNTLVMRGDLSGNPTFRELLHRVRGVALGAYSHQDLPFEKLVEALQPDRDLSRMPLFQVLFVLQNAPQTEFKLPGIDITAMDVHNGTSKFDIGMFMFEKPEGLVCNVEYSTEVFDASTIDRMVNHYQMLLEAVVDDPSVHVGEIPLVTEQERQQIVVEWNDTHKNLAQRPLHEFVEEQVRRTPEAVAVEFESKLLTYHELNVRANRLAHHLIQNGGGPEVPVGIFCERSVDMLVGILGVLKSGSAYVPLDPNYPKERIRHILEDAKAPIVITQKSLVDDLPHATGRRLCLDSDWHLIAKESELNPVCSVKPSNLAYILFTSGSTGRPKGVAIEHHSASTFVQWANRVFTPGELSGVLLSTSICFDLSVFEIFVTWSVGGKVIVAENALYLPTLPAKNDVTLINTVPSAMSELVRMNGIPDSVQVVNLAGEALPDALVEQIYAGGRVQRVYNLYGPTEDTTYSTYTLVTRGSHATIGRPISNTQAYILDHRLNPVPVGVAGELYLAGEGLARGYYGRPDLTGERFVPNPFSALPEARMYRTGDLARFLPGGDIQYLGRIDHQVKLRGFRIELGEIENALDGHPGVIQSVVMAREDIPGEKQLVAYVVPDSGYSGGDESEPAAALGNEQVSQWTEAFDEAYRRGEDVTEATFNIAGWDSSYTREPIPAEEMRVWVETTAERIRELGAKRIWEIGCGTGLLLFRIAPTCEHYHGTDISQAGLEFLAMQIQNVEPKLLNVSLERKAAHEFDTLHGKFDAVVVNSVIQYFPNLDYLIKVLEGAIASVRPGGAVFIGDVRSLPLLEAFHTSVELFKAEDGVSKQDLARRVEKGIRQEGELVVDPAFFNALRHRVPQITHVEIQLKRGRAHNELTRFRYDVTLHVGERIPARVECAWLDWEKQGLSRDALADILRETQPETLGLSSIPNARLRDEAVALEWLKTEEGPASVGDLRKTLGGNAPSSVLEPEDLWTLEGELPYKVEIRWSKSAVEGRCDAILRRCNGKGAVADHGLARFPGENEAALPWASYANNPLRQRVAEKLVPQLRKYIGGKLPEFMVPAVFMVLNAIPLTSNGKVNRRALPVPEQPQTESGSYRTPSTPAQELVASIFADVLRLERVGIDDNFFELGGHSLSATQVVSRIRQNLRVDLPVRSVFECPTVATLAQAAELKLRGLEGLAVPPIEPVSRDLRLPLSFAQQRLWVLDQIEPNNPLYNNLRPLRFTGELDVGAMETALNEVVVRHEVLRTTYHSEKGQPFQVIGEPSHLPLSVVDLSALSPTEREAEATRLVQQENAIPFDLAKDPIVRWRLLRLDQQSHILMVTTNHIADDGWSTGILLHELTELYEAALNGKASPLPAISVQYADYAVWQRNWLQGEVLDQQVAYWRKRLEGAPPILQIPSDRPRPEKPTYRGASHRFLLPASLLESVRALSRQQGSTVFMTMMAAFQTMVMHYTGQPDVVLGTDLANRTSVQTEALIGFFVNLMAFRTDLSGDPTFLELLARVRETALGAYAHQDVPFDKLVEELQPERSLNHNPIVQVLFVQQNTPRSSKPMPGLKMEWFPMEGPSKFDMAVFVSETDKGIAGNWVYSAELFDAATIARMAGMYQIVLQQVTTNPAIHLSGLLDVLKEEDQKQLAVQHQEFRQVGSQKLKTVKRKTRTQD